MSALPPEHHLPLDRVVEMRAAYLSGVSRGIPPNTHITINFREMRGRHAWPTDYHGATEEQKASVTANCRDVIVASLRNWCRRQQPALPFAAVYVLENDPQGGMGPHVHILLHLPSTGYEERARSLCGNVRKTMGWTTPALKSKLLSLEAERERPLLAGKPVNTVFLPFYLTSSKVTPGCPLSDAEQIIRLAYLAKGLRDTEVVTISGVTQTIAQHIQQGAKS